METNEIGNRMEVKAVNSPKFSSIILPANLNNEPSIG